MKSRLLYPVTVLFFLVVSLCLVWGCKSTEGEQTESTLETSTGISDVKTYPIPTENVFIAHSYCYRCPASIGGYYFCSTKHIRHQSVGSQTSTPLCLQPGCEHKDESCEAYMGGIIQQLAEYKGKLYAKIETDDGSIEIVSFDLSTREHKVIDHWDYDPITDNNNHMQVHIIINNIAYDGLYVSHTRYVFDPVTTMQVEESHEYTRYDLVTGEKSEMPFRFSCMGAAGYSDIVTTYGWDEEANDVILKEHYISFRDAETLELRKVVDREQDNYIPTHDPAYKYGSYIVYRCDNTLYSFDAETGASKELVTPEDPITNYWVMDHKVFYITKNVDKIAYFWYADLGDPVPVRLRNDDNTEVMVFSIFYEGTDFFADNNNRVMSKEEFYARNAT